jgi:hypothetical protein
VEAEARTTPDDQRPGALPRLAELQARLAVWWVRSSADGADLRGIWGDALRRLDRALRRQLDTRAGDGEPVLAAPAELVLDCLEAALDAYDHILAAFPYELPEGWHEWLPSPPEE